jgi:IS30 family transposase
MRPMSQSPFQHLNATERTVIRLLDEEDHGVREIARRVGSSRNRKAGQSRDHDL